MDRDMAERGARNGQWRAALRKLEAEPLTYCADFPALAERWNDWWRGKGDRPLLVGAVSQGDELRWDKAFDLLDRPDEWLRVRRAQLEHTYRIGEALPFVRIDIGPVALAAFLGAPLHLAAAEQTAWQEPMIESWAAEAPLALEPDNEWLGRVMRLIEATAEDARGQYLVGLPDLTGALDALANLRSPEKLCLDLFEHRPRILAAAGQAVDAWEQVFDRMYAAILERGAGVTQWVSCWADAPFTVPTCDFNALIGPEDFREICLPTLREQARRAGLCVFHLDGPDAARHARALAETPEITAVQYTPGAGTPSALAKLPMLRMLQEHGKPLFIECPVEEVQRLAEALDPAGLALRVGGLQTRAEADALVAWRDRAF